MSHFLHTALLECPWAHSHPQRHRQHCKVRHWHQQHQKLQAFMHDPGSESLIDKGTPTCGNDDSTSCSNRLLPHHSTSPCVPGPYYSSPHPRLATPSSLLLWWRECKGNVSSGPIQPQFPFLQPHLTATQAIQCHVHESQLLCSFHLERSSPPSLALHLACPHGSGALSGRIGP